MRIGLLTIAVAVLGCYASAVVAEGVASSRQQDSITALTELQAEKPAVRASVRGKQVTRLFGQPLAHGVSPIDAAERFLDSSALVFTVQPDELKVSGLRGAGDSVPLMYDEETGEYKFTMVRYTQQIGDVPVYGADIRILMRNEKDYPVVLAASSLRDVGDFKPVVKSNHLAFDPATMVRTTVTKFSEPEVVVWTGLEDQKAEPRLAVTFTGELGRADQGDHEYYRFVCDAETGEILHQEDLICFEDVYGNVSGMVTEGPAAPQCSAEVLTPFPYAEVSISGGNSAFTDEDGDYTISHSGTSLVTVTSGVGGLRFDVTNVAGSNEVLSTSVLPPGPADFTHNTFNSDEFVLAQANAYANASEVRDFVLRANPDYPTISTQTNMEIRVNRNDNYCPGNAWYDPSDWSLNFCRASLADNNANTSFASVSQHEFGHHVVNMGGSGQGEYGEGMADCIAMIIADDPGLGYGFYYDDCSTPLRSADNDCQYLSGYSCSTCGSEIHLCGKLLSGAVWDIKLNMEAAYPLRYKKILSNILVNSVLLHSGTSIDDNIAIDFLTLDDDDGSLDNGTPHYYEICAGFGDHGITCPEISTGLHVAPAADYVAEGPSGGSFQPSSFAYTVENLGPGSINYSASTTATWLNVSNGSGTLANPGDTAVVTVAIDGSAASLADGRYDSSIQFVNETDHVGDTIRQATLNVGTADVAYEWLMDVDPGWTTEGLWAFGVPSGGGSYNQDPTSGYTGNKVYGYNLSGDYTNNLPATYLTTTAIDCSSLSNVELEFQRWLGVESDSAYDEATVEVSNNGTTWSTIWQATATGDAVEDTSWHLQTFNIADVADGQSTVYVRWGMGPTDVGKTYPGWNIDDVRIVALGVAGPPVLVTLPDGVPATIDPGVDTEITVRIVDNSESYVPGTGMLHYRYDGGAFETTPLTSLGADLFTATLHPSCGHQPEFYFSAEGDGGTTVYEPSNAPDTSHVVLVGSPVTLLDDNFETDQGWVTQNVGASSGDWQRGIPVNDPSWDYDPQADSDGSGSCYLTANSAGNTDVDGGAVRLTSPVMDMSGGNITISYDYFLRLTEDQENTDALLVEIGYGGNWAQIARHSSDGGLSWRPSTITQNTLDSLGITLTSTTQIRFTANDADSQSIVEAGVDAVKVTSLNCQSPSGDGDFDVDGDLDLVDFALFQTCFGTTPLTSKCRPGDMNGDDVVNLADYATLESGIEGPM